MKNRSLEILIDRIESSHRETEGKLEQSKAELVKSKDDLHMALSIIIELLATRHLKDGVLDSKEDRPAARAIRFLATQTKMEVVHDKGDRVRAKHG